MANTNDNGMGYDVKFTDFKFLHINLLNTYVIEDWFSKGIGVKEFKGIDVIGESSKAIKINTAEGIKIIPKTVIKVKGEE